MSVAAQLIIYAGGIAVAAVIFRLLGGRIPRAIAVGLAFWVAMLSFHPLFHTAGGRLGFVAWVAWVAVVSVIVAGLYALLSRGSDRA